MGSLRPRLLWIGVLGLAIFVVALFADTVVADVGRFDVQPRAAAPGGSVELSFAAGRAHGAAGDPRFPISIVGLARAPEPFPCHGREGLCTPATLAPPRRPPFAYLGSARPDPQSSTRYIHVYRFRFEVPNLRPGAYAFVLWCAGCYQGPRGSLIASAFPSGGERAGVLRVRPTRTAAGRRGGAGMTRVGAPILRAVPMLAFASIWRLL